MTNSPRRTPPFVFSQWVHGDRALRHGDVGAGTPILFQHGLGADCQQGLSALLPLVQKGCRIASLECPGHGESPLGDATAATFERFVDFLMDFIDAHQLDRFAMGGISMGASLTLGVAMRLAARHEADRLRAMLLVRPAWCDEPRPSNLNIIRMLGHWIEEEGLDAAAQRLAAEPFYQQLLEENPNCAASIRGVLTRPHAQAHAPVLYRMVEGRPLDDLASLRGLDIPALVVSNDADPLHPPGMADAWAEHLPRAERSHVPPRYLKSAEHHHQLNAAIHSFLQPHFNGDRPG